MTTFCIHGGVPLEGKVRIQGSKNAALPILAATLLTGDVCRITNCPQIADVQHMVTILTDLGCKVHRITDGYLVDSSKADLCQLQGEATTRMRSSLCLMGAMLGRFGEVIMEHPGGCVIGARPIDLHVKAMEELGVIFSEVDGKLVGTTLKLRGTKISLRFPSVGATENILLAAAMAEGDTTIIGAAKEPEVVALCCFLVGCGVKIDGVGTSIICVHGGCAIHGADFVIPADRIVAGTYLFACVGCGGSVFLEDAPFEQMEAVIHVAEQMGACCQSCIKGLYGEEKGLYVQGPERIKCVSRLRTAIYPGFPTDLQSMALTVLTKADGKSCVEERIFENRFRIIDALKKMGADIELYTSEMALVKGVDMLHGASVEACELRGGAALILAGLMAQGKSEITGCEYIERGYANITEDLRNLGARIVSV